MKKALALVFALLLAAPAAAEWASTRVAIHVGPWPSSTDPLVGHLKRGDFVDVLEEYKGWGRITKYVPAKEEGLKGRRKVARWVSLRHLTNDKPVPLPTATCEHPDIAIDAFPKTGPGGLSDEEAEILCRGAQQLLSTDKCKRIVYGDKSLSKPGSFFVNCGGTNLFFTAADLAAEE